MVLMGYCHNQCRTPSLTPLQIHTQTDKGQPTTVKITKQQQALRLAGDDAAFFLEPLITKQVNAEQVAVAVERILRAGLTDRGMPVNVKTGAVLKGTTVQGEAKRIAEKLVAQHAVPAKKAA